MKACFYVATVCAHGGGAAADTHVQMPVRYSFSSGGRESSNVLAVLLSRSVLSLVLLLLALLLALLLLLGA